MTAAEELPEPDGDPSQLEWFEFYRPASAEGPDVIAQLSEQLQSFPTFAPPRGARIGVAVGSRGIARIAEVVRVVVEYLHSRGAEPVIIPAMGSHGGATPSGQVKVLHDLGVDEAALGVPIEASMEVEEIGRLVSGRPVYMSKAALGCDEVVLVNRVKPHTEFRGQVESGLTKMMTIGLGKERGASSLHSAGFDSFHSVLPEAAAIVERNLRVAFGVALLEGPWHNLRRAEVVPGDQVREREEALLSEAWAHFGRLPFDGVEVLVLREIGKTISGTGMDPNVTGRFPDRHMSGSMKAQRVLVLDITESSGGNAQGMGLADIITERLRSKINWAATYANARASKALSNANLPVVVDNDFDALALGLQSLTGDNVVPPRVVALHNTLEVNHFAVTAPLVPAAQEAGYSPIGEAQRAEFGLGGELLRIGSLEFFSPAS